VDPDGLEKNVARKTTILEIEESDKPVVPVAKYAKLLVGLEDVPDRAIFLILIACFCALRASGLFGLTWVACPGPAGAPFPDPF
jgi:hypothetical protein